MERTVSRFHSYNTCVLYPRRSMQIIIIGHISLVITQILRERNSWRGHSRLAALTSWFLLWQAKVFGALTGLALPIQQIGIGHSGVEFKGHGVASHHCVGRFFVLLREYHSNELTSACPTKHPHLGLHSQPSAVVQIRPLERVR